jgi:hypothetical protein
MNKRLIELTEQAMMNSLFEPIAPYFTIGTGDGKMDLPVVFVEKLAELIIKEVLAVQEQLIAEGHNAWHLNKPTREHFGVE